MDGTEAHADLVGHYIQLCRSPVMLSLAEWEQLPAKHKAALEEACQAARQLASIEGQTLTPETVLLSLSEYDGGEAFRRLLRWRNAVAFEALDAAGVDLGPSVEVVQCQ